MRIIGTIASCIKACASRTPLDEAQCLTFAREVLFNSNRTQFGGDSYEATDLICCNPDLVFITPHGQESSPIRINVSGKDSSGEGGDFVTVTVQAKMVFNVNARDPDPDDDTMVWAHILSLYER